MLEKVLNDSERMEKADTIFTNMLEALENGEFEKVQKLYTELMDTSINIEQRLAAQYLVVMANSLDKNEVKDILEEIYDYDGGQ